MAINRDFLVVGARFGDAPGVPDAGAAYVFRREGTAWVEEAKLTASDAVSGDWYPTFSLSISGNRIVIGAPFHDEVGERSGTAYVFRREESNWVQEAELAPLDPRPFALFGSSVSVVGDVAVVGAGDHPSAGSASGAVYVFRREGTTWQQEAKLVPFDATPLDRFGTSVELDDDLIVVGARFGDAPGVPDSGAAYVFRREGMSWIQEAKVTAADAAALHEFGTSVSISNGTIVVGSWKDGHAGEGSGSAYVFRRQGRNWFQDAKLIAFDAAAEDEFGASVSLYGSLAIVGSHYDDDAGRGSGSAYVFRRDDNGTPSTPSDDFWVHQSKLTASDAQQDDQFGQTVSISAEFVVAGAHGNDDAGPDSGSGSAYVFAIAGDCNNNDTIDGCDILAGTSQDSNGDAIPDECEAAPTVSEWGFMVMTFLLLSGLTVKFGVRRVKTN